MLQNLGKGKAPVTLGLIAVNLLLFLWAETHGGSENTGVMLRLGAVFWPKVCGDGEYWRLLTAAFLHFGIEHIANNMLLLFLLGDKLERALGQWKYLALYLLSAIGSNAVSLWFLPVSDRFHTVSAGASGAVFGVVGGLIVAVVRNGGKLYDLTAKRLLLFALLSFSYSASGQNVDNTAHAAGLVIGFFLCLLLYHPAREQKTGPELPRDPE